MNKYIKTILITFVLIMGAFFINIEGSKAFGDGNGYSKCFYYQEFKLSQNKSGTVADDPNVSNRAPQLGDKDYDNYGYYLAIIVTKSEKGKFVANISGNYGMDKTGTILKISDTAKQQIVDQHQKFYDGSKWSCPKNIYVEPAFSENKEAINNGTITDIFSYDGVLSNSIKWGLEKDESAQTGKPKVPTYNDLVKEVKPGVTTNQYGTSTQGNSTGTNNDEMKKKITDWATDKTTNNTELSGGTSGCDLIDHSIIQFLDNLFKIIQIIGIILVVVLSAIDFIKAITGADEDGLKGAIKNTWKRLILAVILLLLPMVIIWLLNIINANATGQYEIGSNGEVICK